VIRHNGRQSKQWRRHGEYYETANLGIRLLRRLPTLAGDLLTGLQWLRNGGRSYRSATNDGLPPRSNRQTIRERSARCRIGRTSSRSDNDVWISLSEIPSRLRLRLARGGNRIIKEHIESRLRLAEGPRALQGAIVTRSGSFPHPFTR